MKNLLTILAALLMGTQTLAAQNDNQNQTDANTTHVYNSIVSRTDDQEGRHTWNLNLLGVSSESVNISISGNNRYKSHWNSDIGIANPYFGWSELSTKDFDLRTANSLEFGFNIIENTIWNNSRSFGLEIDLGCSWTRYVLKGDNVLYNTPGGQTVCAPYIHPEGRDYSRPRLTYASWRLPVMMHIRSTRHKHMFSIGAEAELRHHLRSRIKVGHNKKYYAEGHDLNINPASCNLIVSFGTKKFSIFGRYGLTEFFDQDNTKLSAHPFMIGLRF